MAFSGFSLSPASPATKHSAGAIDLIMKFRKLRYRRIPLSAPFCGIHSLHKIIKVLYFVFLGSLFLTVSGEDNLYARLGLRKEASQNAIKKAYRAKARATHPDKNPLLDPIIAAENFRQIVEAYETLSDTNTRREYDRSGQTPASQRSWTNNQQNQRNQQYQGFQNFWNFGFGGFNGFGQQQRGPRMHHLMYNSIYRAQIIDARSRVISVLSLEHLQLLTSAGDDSDFYDENQSEQKLDKYVLLAFYDSSIPNCESKLENEVLYPWPFAGYSSEHSDSSIWWDEIMFTGKVDLSEKAGNNGNNGNNMDTKKLGEYFGIPNGVLTHETCPSIVMLPRGEYLSRTKGNIRHVTVSEDFRRGVWSQLKMRITFVNNTPWVLKFWWLDGYRGIPQTDIPVQSSYTVDTFLSHSFFFRADFVDGNQLTNQSGLMWYTAIIKDDNTVLPIKPRCFDHSGDCVRWQQEGFCDKNSDTFYVRKNRQWADWVIENCFVSCKTGCGAEIVAGRSEL